jgi:hypothetical protein
VLGSLLGRSYGSRAVLSAFNAASNMHHFQARSYHVCGLRDYRIILTVTLSYAGQVCAHAWLMCMCNSRRVASYAAHAHACSCMADKRSVIYAPPLKGCGKGRLMVNVKVYLFSNVKRSRGLTTYQIRLIPTQVDIINHSYMPVIRFLLMLVYGTKPTRSPHSIEDITFT